MGWDEAARLARLLVEDPSSQLGAAMAKLDYTSSRTDLLLADLYDITVMAHSDPKRGKPKPHPMRPFKAQDTTKRRPKRAPGVTDEVVIAAMRAAGHEPPV